MQHALIICRIESFTAEQGGELLCLNAEDHKQRSITLQGYAGQQVNVQTLKNQQLPLVLLADKLIRVSESRLTVPPTALVSIVPLPAASIGEILDAGRGGEILDSLALKEC
ncbi:hypothetical protein [Neptuniibacter halophilus]|uniref:hypothetical protein n=1 Tax=Neptuniibacter halophilus TaxID=651666 RepID=UPI002572B0BE|nr:hypothetical protein [Neptuniibacter halophilus]